MAEYIDYDHYISEKTLNQLKELADQYSKTFGNSEYSSSNILNEFQNYENKDKIRAITNAINDIGEKEGLNYDKAREDYNIYLADNSENNSISQYMDSLIREGDQAEILSFLGQQGLELSDQYLAHELAKENPEYVENLDKYSKMTAQRNYMFENEGGTTQEFEIEWIETVKSVESSPAKVMDNNNVFKCVDKIEESRNKNIEDTKKQDTQLQTTDNNSILRTIKNKISKIMESLKNLFKGNKGFESDIINPAENILEESTNENSLNEKDISSGFKEYITDKINSAKENMQNLPFEIETDGKDLSSIMRDGLGIDKDKFNPIPNAGLEEDIETEKLGNLGEGR